MVAAALVNQAEYLTGSGGSPTLTWRWTGPSPR